MREAVWLLERNGYVEETSYHKQKTHDPSISFRPTAAGVALAVAFLGVDVRDVVRTHGKNTIEASGKEPELKAFLVDIKNNVDQAMNALEYWY
jgi:hypothetical protein